ncbi:MAG: hypothetical protein ACFFA0_02270 [Promethearchaeota archaeon]
MIITAMYIGARLLTPKLKIPILIIFLIISIFFERAIFLDPLNSFNFIPEPPQVPSKNLIDYNVNLLTLAGMLMGGLLLPVLIFLGFGILIKGLKTSGIVRKNYLLLSTGSLCFCIFGFLEGLTVPGILVIFVRFGYLSSFWLMYFELKA